MMAIVEIENLGRRLSSANEYLSGTPRIHSGTAYGVHGSTSCEFKYRQSAKTRQSYVVIFKAFKKHPDITNVLK
jgi:hypothetical protein